MVYPLKVRFPTFGYKTIFLSPLLRFEISGGVRHLTSHCPIFTRTDSDYSECAGSGIFGCHKGLFISSG